MRKPLSSAPSNSASESSSILALLTREADALDRFLSKATLADRELDASSHRKLEQAAAVASSALSKHAAELKRASQAIQDRISSLGAKINNITIDNSVELGPDDLSVIDNIAGLSHSIEVILEKYNNIETPLHETLLDSREGNKPHDQAISKIDQLKQHAIKHGYDGLEDRARELFPEWNFAPRRLDEFTTPNPDRDSAMPEAAPETYQGLRGPESPPEFVQRVYGPWLGQGLTRAHVRKLDPGLYQAINNWSRKNEWPADVDLPTLKEQNDRWVDRVKNVGAGDISHTEAMRLAGVMQRRQPKQQQR